ncbi:transglutaminase-like protein [Candidatus Koribacter versatilis Ellin345]|uniref:Transglutaminase-like protein n=1 Tax=Koribacter versatilis (strain Ellin345) TaxID=204669 RepID=Q1IP03_KORVE|nr:transglutaminase-like domain-containing protein [Candidatus Koribacter versatilis]ABF41397.1 transglutaminase-like protein [Candidatus Koribacter versatilis Ellin345]
MRKLALFLLCLVVSLPAVSQQTRHFTFHYAFTVRNIEPGQKIELWMPQAHSDDFQEVKILSVTSDLPLKPTRDTKYGNTMYHAVAEKADKAEYNVDVTYDVVRHERIGLPRDGLQPHLLKASLKQSQEYLGPDKLVPVTGKLADIAAAQVQGKTATLDKARAIYDYVFTTMKYDKSGTGWGRGDAEWACDSKRGNCTDFHSVFISMARSQHIPARFEIGFPLPKDKHSGDIAGYHCWAEFYDSQLGWVPVDISEAWKDQQKRDYFFGAHDANRVQFSMGRDLVLTPKQAGDPLNYFVYPYVEVNGKKFENVANHFSFEEKTAGETAQR